jgi:hypothetical protein
VIGAGVSRVSPGGRGSYLECLEPERGAGPPPVRNRRPTRFRTPRPAVTVTPAGHGGDFPAGAPQRRARAGPVTGNREPGPHACAGDGGSAFAAEDGRGLRGPRAGHRARRGRPQGARRRDPDGSRPRVYRPAPPGRRAAPAARARRHRPLRRDHPTTPPAAAAAPEWGSRKRRDSGPGLTA